MNERATVLNILRKNVKNTEQSISILETESYTNKLYIA